MGIVFYRWLFQMKEKRKKPTNHCVDETESDLKYIDDNHNTGYFSMIVFFPPFTRIFLECKLYFGHDSKKKCENVKRHRHTINNSKTLIFQRHAKISTMLNLWNVIQHSKRIIAYSTRELQLKKKWNSEFWCVLTV